MRALLLTRAALVIAALFIATPAHSQKHDFSPNAVLGIELTFRMSHPHLTVSGTGLASFTDIRKRFLGTRERLRSQNARADSEGLTHFTDASYGALREREELVPVLPNPSLALDPRTPERFHYLRPWARAFVERLALDFYVAFGRPIQVNSASRTREYQRALQKRNRNAASAYSPETASLHLRGITFDIAKLDLATGKSRPKNEIAWLWTYLGYAQRSGTVEVTEEFSQAVFHVVVFKSYEPSERTLPPVLFVSAGR